MTLGLNFYKVCGTDVRKGGKKAATPCSTIIALLPTHLRGEVNTRSSRSQNIATAPVSRYNMLRVWITCGWDVGNRGPGIAYLWLSNFVTSDQYSLYSPPSYHNKPMWKHVTAYNIRIRSDKSTHKMLSSSSRIVNIICNINYFLTWPLIPC